MNNLTLVESSITNILIQENHTDVEKEKIKFGVRLILHDLWKILFLYIVAFFLNCFMATLITHITFIVLRQVCFGFHFQNNMICLLASTISLPVCLYIITNLCVSLDQILFFSGVFSTLILLLLAPVETKKRPVFNKNHRNHLRKQIFIRLSVLWIVILILGENYQLFFLYAINLATISILIQKFSGGRKMKFKKLLLNKISNLIILFASSATVYSCNLVFHEVDIPEILKKEAKF